MDARSQRGTGRERCGRPLAPAGPLRHTRGMRLSRRANVLLLLFCLAVGASGGAVLAEWFVKRFDVPSNDPRELLAAGIAYLGLGGGIGCYFVCIAAVRRMTGPADRRSPETDYDDKPPSRRAG
jgi:hypothetical protein